MVGLQIQSRPLTNTTASRTGQSGGPIGGPQKAGMWTGQAFMRVANIGNHWTYRIPQRQPTVVFALTNTTRRPVQRNRNGYSITHSGMLG